MEGLLHKLKTEVLKDKTFIEEMAILEYLSKLEEINTSPVDFNITKDPHFHMKTVELIESLTTKDWMLIQSYMWTFLAAKTMKTMNSISNVNFLPICPTCASQINCKFCGQKFNNVPFKYKHQRLCRKNPRARIPPSKAR